MRGPADVRLELMATTDDRRETDSGIEIKPVYTPEDVPDLEHGAARRVPVHTRPEPTMYRGRPWTMRQYAGFGSAEETNERFRLAARARARRASRSRSTCRRSSATTRTIPSRAARSAAPASRSTRSTTCASLFDGIPLDRVSTSMTINAPAALLLAALRARGARSRASPGDELRGTVQNDILKEYIARGNYIFPPRPSMRITTDLFAYCAERLPHFNTISISRLPHPRGRLDGRAGARVHARQRHRVRRGGGRRRALAVDEFGAARVVLLQRAQRLPRRRWRSSARRAGCGPA